jgi:ribosomal protein S24E
MAWGDDWGGTGAPSDKGYTKIYSNVSSFAVIEPSALRAAKALTFE